MSTNAAIGILQSDGRILTAKVRYDGGELLAGKLAEHYSTAERATALVNLGNILVVRDAPADCELSLHGGGPELLTAEQFDDLIGSQLRNQHLFDGTWHHFDADSEENDPLIL